MIKTLTLGFVLALAPTSWDTCCEKGNPPKCYQCYRSAKDLTLTFNLEGHWRCIVTLNTQIIYINAYPTHASCLLACKSQAKHPKANTKDHP